MGEAVLELDRVERVASDQGFDEREIAEIREEGSVAGQQQLFRVVTTETPIDGDVVEAIGGGSTQRLGVKS